MSQNAGGQAAVVAANPPPASVTYPPRLIRYTTAIILAAAPVVAAAPFFIGWSSLHGIDLLGVVLFALAATIAESKPVPLDENASRTVSLSFIFILAEQALFGWAWGVVAAVVCMSVSQALERVTARRLLFNTGVYALATALSALPGLAIAWDVVNLDTRHVGLLTLVVFAGGAVFVLTNVVLVAIVAALAQGATVRSMLDDYVRHAGPAFAIMAFISALATALWLVAPVLELLLAGPLFALALYQRYAYRTVLATRAAETDGLTRLRNHRSFQTICARRWPSARARGSARGAGGHRQLQVDQRPLRPPGRRPGAAGAGRPAARGVRRRERIPHRRRGVRRAASPAERPEGLRALERFTRRLWRTAFPHGEPVTISAGIAAYPDNANDRDELLRVADSALYWAKNHGKSRSCVYAPTRPVLHARASSRTTAERHARLRAAESLIRVVDAKDTYTGAHSQSVVALVAGDRPRHGAGRRIRSIRSGSPACCTTWARLRSPKRFCRSRAS